MNDQRHWDWRLRSIAEVVWPSFLAGAVGTAVFFALVDPDGLALALVEPRAFSTTTVYSLGFFFFWSMCGLSSLLTTWLIRTERRRDEFPH